MAQHDENRPWLYSTPSTDIESPPQPHVIPDAVPSTQEEEHEGGTTHDAEELTVEAADAVAVVVPMVTEWKELPLSEKISLLDACLERLREHAGAYNAAAMERRGYMRPETAPVETQTEEVMMYLVSVLHLASWMRTLRTSLAAVVQTGSFPRPSSSHVEEGADPSIVRVKLPPDSTIQWLLTGMGEFELHVRQEEKLQHDPQDVFGKNGGVAVILGAGNYDAPIDILTAMFIENCVAVYKVSPLNAPLLPIFANIFGPLLKKKYLVFTKGGPSEAATLLHDPAVTKWFMTGNIRTAYSILYGSMTSPWTGTALGTVPNEALESGLMLRKPMTIELGNVSPYIVCPGRWGAGDLRRHARHLAFALLFNGGHICAHPQIVLTCRQWPQREAFLTALRTAIEEAPLHGHFYPDASERFHVFEQKLKKEGVTMELWKGGTVGFASSLDHPTSTTLTQEETFNLMSGEIALDTPPTLEAFLPKAVEFSNASLAGSLAATIIAKTSRHEEPLLQRAITDLKYGSVGLNCYGLCTIYFPQLCWGGHPECTDLGHLGSGIGWFGNCYGYKHPMKSVIRSSFHSLSHHVQIIPRGSEVRRLSKMFARICAALCRPEQGMWNLTTDLIKIGAALTLGV